jgi:hypothetical protein
MNWVLFASEKVAALLIGSRSCRTVRERRRILFVPFPTYKSKPTYQDPAKVHKVFANNQCLTERSRRTMIDVAVLCSQFEEPVGSRYI